MKHLPALFLTVLCWLASTTPLTAAPSPFVRVDQVGYLPTETKFGVVVSASATGPFDVRRVSDDASVFSGSLAAAFTDLDSGDSIRTADFSTLSTTGSYYLDVAGVGVSQPFDIGLDAFMGAFVTVMRGFYGQRCGIAVNLGTVDGVAYNHAICHASGAANDLPSTYHASSGKSGTKNTPKGWHDAGDFGKYVVNSGISTGELLWAYEWFSNRVGNLDLNIPESGDGTPDVLDEARWNIEWMLTMQDTDGGVWHKNTSAGFGSFTLPEFDNAGTRYIVGRGGATPSPYKTSCSTADFAAVMAIAARLFQPFDATFSTTCLTAAESAWTWVSANPNVSFVQPAGISTGGYNDNNCSDERLWAAAELFHTTGTASYDTYVTTNTPGGTLFTSTNIQGWGSMRNLALWTYYFAPGGNSTLKGRIYNDTLTAANTIASRTSGATNGYKVSLTSGQYYWGSNEVAAQSGVFLLAADRMAPSTIYVNAAMNNLHYLLGRNTHNVSFVTHVGENFLQNPHHRPSASPQYSALAPWPGLLVGGPNANDNDGSPLDSIPKPPTGRPAKRWVDHQNSYASNETAINWNAPLAFLLASAVPPWNCGLVTCTPTPSFTPTPTETPCGFPSETCTPTDTPTPTSTPTPTATPSVFNVLFPNPVLDGGPLNFYYNVDAPTDEIKVKIFTTSYRKIFEDRGLLKTTGQHLYQLDWAKAQLDLANGLYYVVVYWGTGGSETHKVMKLLIRK